MLQEKIVENIASLFVKKTFIQADDQEVFQYYLESMIAALSIVGTMAIIAMLSDQVVTSSVYLIVFFLFRSVCGGYHASTHLRCYALTIGTYGVFLAVSIWTSLAYLFNISGLLIITINLLIFKFSPIDTENKPFSDQEKINYRHKSIVYLLMFDLIIIAVSVLGDPELAYQAILGAFQAAVSVMVGYQCRRKKEGKVI